MFNWRSLNSARTPSNSVFTSLSGRAITRAVILMQRWSLMSRKGRASTWVRSGSKVTVLRVTSTCFIGRPMKQVDVTRSTVTLDPDRTHVLARPFRLMSDQRCIKITARVMALPESEVNTLLDGVRAEFSDRQLNIDEFLRRRFDDVSPYLLDGQKLSDQRKLLLGGYFSHEYSLESAALFNPSMVPHPDQSDVPPGSLRFILSLRATAEGHVSSIAFRSGI